MADTDTPTTQEVSPAAGQQATPKAAGSAETIDTIHRLTLEASETREKVATLREQLKDITEQNEEYRSVADEIKELTKKRADAKRALADDKDYQSVSADLDDYRLKLKDLNEILSQHLVLYYEQTKQTKLVTREGETRSVILSAKLGKTEA